MKRIPTLSGALVLISVAGCALWSEKIIIDGAVAGFEPNRVHVAGQKPLKGAVGDKVVIYQRVKRPMLDQPHRSWRVLEPVAEGTVLEVTQEGAWVAIETGTVAPSGETQLRTRR